ncbi:tyrosine aminotransferase [Actinoplanes sp. OR16]|uniref:aminotransferase class I/II-fold pyridoxal phosphate-dependent enzyme n=1 Tax=Actinoplanes sp. OR16 TaxID=946334 RepID=UPI000F6FEF07|nr:aminotransferase class I/II-fold pyridoxal phosphate-dependent enzyme [Actinoplanes sp. OR16]BBH69056.1 tyrosine aminotransferase [Actinoplanes sp. OR16]
MLLSADPLWELTAACGRDTRPGRLDLIVGVYRDDSGASPIMRAVRAAESRLARSSTTKAYVGPSGDHRFLASISELILDDPSVRARATAVQTVAGTGALRLLAELIAATGPDRTVHLGVPAYVNHQGVLRAAGLRVDTHPVADMLAAASVARPGDVLMIQGCCHNPTGYQMPASDWDALAEVLYRRGVVPFIDQAYFGLGDGLEADLDGMRRLLRVVPEAYVAVSGSKAWGLYSERVGAALVIGTSPARDRALLEGAARVSYSQPPAHGAALVAEILTDPSLRSCWRDELESMRLRLGRLRSGLALRLSDLPGFAGLSTQRGMFLTLPLSPEAMESLRVDHGVYGLPTGRINLAGLPSPRVPEVAAAIRAVAQPSVPAP